MTRTHMETGSDTAWIVERAKAQGFALCGVVPAGKFPELARMEEWLQRGYAGEMRYLADARRRDPQSVMPAVRSVIVCALNYDTNQARSTEAPAETDTNEPRGWISRYAWGRDYHDVLQEKLEVLVTILRERFPDDFVTRTYTDTGPLHERVLAKHAGLGWLGKNTLLLNQKIGSFFFLGVILTTLELEPTLGPDEIPPRDLCGSCRRCLDACPTGAFAEPYVMDARRCIAYLTIELKGSIPEELRTPMGRHVFGCDICQDVCPWNRRTPVTSLADFEPRSFPAQGSVDSGEAEGGRESLFLPRLEWLASMSEEEFRMLFRGSPIKRTKWRGLVRNACIALGNSGIRRGSPEHVRVCTLLKRLAQSPQTLISESAQWALSRIQ